MPDRKPALSEGAVRILKERYLQSGETPKDMFKRVAKEVASVEEDPDKWEKIFYEAMVSLEFVPNSPTLMNAGTEMNNLSACFVLPVEDDLSSIHDTLGKAALIFKSGGGCGFSFSKLRPNGDVVHSSGGKASGPISFMKVYDKMAEVVEQGGKRRGAMLGSLSVHHPDILEFVTAKKREGILENFNISVEVTDEFMEALAERESYELRNPRGGHPNDPENDMVVDSIKATEVFDRVKEGIWTNGEPGVLFVDTMNADNPHDYEIGDENYISTTNPCAEQSLPPYGSCNLGHVNLSKFADANGFDWDSLARAVETGVRFLDDVISVGKFPLPEIKSRAENERRIGLGIMGWHEALLKRGMKYGSSASIELARKLSEFIYERADEASAALGEEKGSNGGGRRNATLLTVAPTGTTSMIAGTTYGIEPLHQVCEEKCAIDEIVDNPNPTANKILAEGDPDGILVTGPELPPKKHIDMQAAFQENVDASISKTINLPPDFPENEIGDLIVYGWKKGVKGLTLYREGSRVEEPIRTGKKKEIPPRPRVVDARSYREPLGCGKTMYLNMTRKDGEPFETFLRLGKSGGCMKAFSEALSRITSLFLRIGGDPNRVVHSLKGVRCPEGKDSCPSLLAKVLEEDMEKNGRR